jgi:hypothetical protein
MLLNNLNFNSSYNIAADSLRWSNVRFSAGTRLLKDKLALNFNGSLDPYQVNEEGRQINRFNPNIFRLTNANLTANYSISSADFDKSKKDSKDNNESNDTSNGNGANNPRDIMGMDLDPRDTRQNNSNKNKTSKTELYRAKIPWSINLVYSANYSNNGVDPGEIGVHTLGFGGNIELSPKWKVGYSSGYDVKSGAFSFSRFNFTRDLDSWRFNFNWVPFGTNSSYTFFIGIKSSTLADLKWDKNKPPDRRLF